MKLVFLAHPVSGDIEGNMKSMKQWARLAVQEGLVPMAPYFLLTQILDDQIAEERGLGMMMGQAVIEICDLVWVCGEHVTAGMTSDLRKARAWNVRVIYKADSELEKLKCGENKHTEMNKIE